MHLYPLHIWAPVSLSQYWYSAGPRQHLCHLCCVAYKATLSTDTCDHKVPLCSCVRGWYDRFSIPWFNVLQWAYPKVVNQFISYNYTTDQDFVVGFQQLFQHLEFFGSALATPLINKPSMTVILLPIAKSRICLVAEGQAAMDFSRMLSATFFTAFSCWAASFSAEEK